MERRIDRPLLPVMKTSCQKWLDWIAEKRLVKSGSQVRITHAISGGREVRFAGGMAG